MNILALDSTAKVASVAIINEKEILSEKIVNNGLTHSETLVPMVSEMLEEAKISADDIDFFACNTGPGSFTGVRIGVSVIKGLAMKNDTPCISVSTLDSISLCGKNFNGTVCAVMDARRNQVY
ncbi:MAG: tRNA (adenosine(37)-N6)-threonylcarbamoyltransferase complex dimerization subunit type 1 TsaB, partial [Acutalibacteraceae bacterium]